MMTSNGQDDIIPYENEFGLWVPLDKFNALQKENIRLRQLFELEHENHMSMVRDRDLKWQMADDNYAKAKLLEQTVDRLNEENVRMARRIAELESKYKDCSDCRDNAIIERNALVKRVEEREAELERPIGIKDRYQRIAASDAFKEAYVDRDIGETLEIKEDL